jgi:uncharacterized membrane protein
MPLYYSSIALAILANLVYHICQKRINPNVNPMISAAVTYSVALAVSLILIFIPFKDARPAGIQFKELNWASYMLGFAIVGLEAGFLLAYRAGWNVAQCALFSNIAVTFLLLPIGIIVFKESVSITNMVGIGFAILGLFMMNFR